MYKGSQVNTYQAETSAVIGKTREKWGTLHCMAAGMPLVIMGRSVPTAEHLYQALRTTDPEVQGLILKEPNPFKAKRMVAYQYPAMPIWDSVRVEAMRYTLRVKWMQSDRFRNVLEETESLPIVERSFNNNFWGAIPRKDGSGTLIGENTLGNLLMELRSEVRGILEPIILNLEPFIWFGQPVTSAFTPITHPEMPALLFDLEMS